MRNGAMVLAGLILSNCYNAPPPQPPVTMQLTQSVDVTGDGKPENITLGIKAANSRAPVQWLLTIDSNGTTIFERDGDDSEVDALFDDREALPGCSDYLACKNQYYLHTMLDNLIDENWDPSDILDMQRGGKLPGTVYTSLSECCSVTGPKADAIVADLERRIREHKAILLNPPISPVETGPRVIYSAEAGQFIEIDPE